MGHHLVSLSHQSGSDILANTRQSVNCCVILLVSFLLTKLSLETSTDGELPSKTEVMLNLNQKSDLLPG